MGKFCFPSCCCFSSSSSPQEVNIVVHSTQPSQQPANSGPSTPLLSSQPSQQPTSAGHSTPSSSSQPSQQPVNAGPSTATNVDLESFLQKFNDISQLHNLIQFIDELLKRVEKKEEGSSSAPSSYIQDGQKFLELVDKHISKIPQKNDSEDGASAEIEKVFINLLKGAAQIHWVGAALSVVGFVLARYNEMSNNQKECLEILKVLFKLGKQILKLSEQMPEEKEKLNDAVKCIVEGCIMCASQLATGKFVRFLTASVNADGLKGFQAKIDCLSKDLTFSTVINIQNKFSKIASQSKAAYNLSVGIESAQERVIQLLDLNAQHTSAQVVVVYGFGGIGKTTLADAVYDHIDTQIYKKCKIHMDQHCSQNDIKVLQERILEKLFEKKVDLTDCDHGREKIWRVLKQNPDRPVFLYIDNGLKSTNLIQLLPKDLGNCLPPSSRIIVTTRNLRETYIFPYWNVKRQEYLVNPLPETEARKILLKRATDRNDEKHIQDLLKLCGGVPLLLELAGAQLAISIRNTNIMVLELEMLKAGKEVIDISDRMVDFVYNRLLEPVKEAFLDIASLFYRGPNIPVLALDSIGEEEFRALEEASFIKRNAIGFVTIHDIVEARGKKISEQNRITDPEALLDCLKDKEKLKNLKGIYFRGKHEQPPIEISDDHLKCMSNSLRVLSYEEGSQITFKKKCHKPFKELRYLKIPDDISDLPMEFEKHENLAYYSGPFTQAMSLYELPPSLRCMRIKVSAENGVTDSKVPPRVTSSLVKLNCYLNNMQMLPDGIEKLIKLEGLYVRGGHQLRELPPDFGQLSNLTQLALCDGSTLSELPYSVGQLNNLKYLRLEGCSALSTLPSEFVLLKNLQWLDLSNCSGLKELPCDVGQLKSLSYLNLRGCSELKEWPLSLGDLIRKGC